MVVYVTGGQLRVIDNLFDKYREAPSSIGRIINAYDSPRCPRGAIPYVVDNGAYGCFTRGEEWDAERFLEGLDKTLHGPAPEWIVVPDVVGNKGGTITQWCNWADLLRETYHAPLAFAVQDGMIPGDVPVDADVVFIGGTTDWKWANLERFCDVFKRVHCARVNTFKQLNICHDAGCESVDGTGFFRGGEFRIKDLTIYLACRAGELPLHQQTTFAALAGLALVGIDLWCTGRV